MNKSYAQKHLKTLINELNRLGEKLIRKEVLVLWYTNIDKVTIFCVLHDKVALLTRRRSERATRNREEITLRKSLTI